MIDGMFDREYQAGRGALNSSLATSFAHFSHVVSHAFEVLNRIEYQAPWSAQPKRGRCR